MTHQDGLVYWGRPSDRSPEWRLTGGYLRVTESGQIYVSVDDGYFSGETTREDARKIYEALHKVFGQEDRMREIKTHHINECNRNVRVYDKDGAQCHRYYIAIGNEPIDDATQVLEFQEGPIKEVGVNGITNEALLAIVIDRMEYFQGGDFRCRENALALTKLQEAMHWLDHRTREREERGVEGTNKL